MSYTLKCYAHSDNRLVHQSDYKKAYFFFFAARECRAHTAKKKKFYALFEERF